MAENSVFMPGDRTGDSVGMLPFGDTCHKSIYMHADVCVLVSVSLYAHMCVCRCTYLPINWINEHA